MPETDITSTTTSNLTDALPGYSVPSETTDGVFDSKESTWQMTDWEENLGYYKNIPELQTAVDAKANWTLGAGFTASEPNMMLLNSFKGIGKDSFNTILLNMVRTYTIAGDSFAEVIRDKSDKNKPLVNLKPLDPSSIVIVYNSKGRIIRYDQVTKAGVGEKVYTKSFEPDEILHLSRKRIADEVHGIGVVPSVKWIINARNEAMDDWRVVLHRNVKPIRIWYLDTDDDSEIAKYKSEVEGANKDTENMFVPKGTVETEIASVAPNATLSPLEWIDRLNDYFYQAVNVPQIIIGNAKEFTDASGKIVYLAFEQAVKGDQLYIEEQVLSQLNIEIALTFPASLQNDLVSDGAKDPMTSAASPNDTTAELEGNT